MTQTDMTGADTRYFRVSPRGFANKILYIRVRPEQVAEVEAHFDGYEDDFSGRHCGWTADKRARMPGVAIEWDDRAYFGL